LLSDGLAQSTFNNDRIFPLCPAGSSVVSIPPAERIVNAAFLSEAELFSVVTVARRWKAFVFNHENHALASVATFFYSLSDAELFRLQQSEVTRERKKFCARCVLDSVDSSGHYFAF
jgi:hypothetical protein